MDKMYHVGFCKGGGYDGHGANTLIIQARESKDFLSPQLWAYLGQRVTTKKKLHANRNLILAQINKTEGTNYKFAVVD